MKKIILILTVLITMVISANSISASTMKKRIVVDINENAADFITFCVYYPGVNTDSALGDMTGFTDKVKKLQTFYIHKNDTNVNFDVLMTDTDPAGEYKVVITHTKGLSERKEYRSIVVASEEQIDTAIADIHSSNTPSALINKYVNDDEVFYIDLTDMNKIDGFDKYFIQIRKQYYPDSYEGVADVEKNIALAQALFHLLNDDSSSLCKFIENGSDVLGEVTENFGKGAEADKLKDCTVSNFMKNRKDTLTFAETISLLNQSIAIAFFEYGTNNEKASALVKYSDEFGINLSLLEKNNIEAVEAVKYISGDTKEGIYSSYNSSIQKILENRNNQSTQGGGSGSGGGGSFSISGPTVPLKKQDNPQSEQNGDTENNNDAQYENKQSLYEDVNTDFWAFEYIDYLSKKNVIAGYENKFRPNDSITRAEFVKLIVTVFDVPQITDEKLPFFDCVITDWYYPHIQAGYKAGLISGISGSEFGATMNISRQDAAVIIQRALNTYSNESEENVNNTVAFSDAEAISDYSKDAVSSLYNMGIISGYDDNTFCPLNSISRAEAAAIIYKAYINVEN